MTAQQQFLQVVDCETAKQRFRAACPSEPLAAESVPLAEALGRVLAEDVESERDVPAFDRSNFDGYAVRAEDLIGADEEHPRALRLLGETAAAGTEPTAEVTAGTAMPIATGGMLPRGADTVVMVEDTAERGEEVLVQRPLPAGFGVTFAGTDIARGECVLRRGTRLTSRDTAIVAALGRDRVRVVTRPRVAVLSTGDELVLPGQPLATGQIYDSNSRVISDALREMGAVPVEMGIASDDAQVLRGLVEQAVQTCDAVLLSGGTSKGAGDISYRVVSELGEIHAHGVAIKPGKPICLASIDGKPVVVLPGFPTSAVFTFHEFVAPVIRTMAGLPAETPKSVVEAELPVPVRSQIGRREYLLVSLVRQQHDHARCPLAAYPLGKGSGSVTTFSYADGFVAIDQRVELVEAGTVVPIRLIADDLRLADLFFMGSHCVGLEYLLSELTSRGTNVRFLAVGSWSGLEAVREHRADIAGIHLLDPKTGTYNRPFLSGELELIRGYRRRQGIVFRPDDDRFCGKSWEEIRQTVTADSHCRMVNRNQGSGTRVLIDEFLHGHQPPGYAQQPRTHHAVAAAVSQRRADWGIAVEWVAQRNGLGFCPIREEDYDFVVRRSAWQQPSVAAFRQLLRRAETEQHLRQLGFLPPGESAGAAAAKSGAE